jgi:hypothetical protein
MGEKLIVQQVEQSCEDVCVCVHARTCMHMCFQVGERTEERQTAHHKRKREPELERVGELEKDNTRTSVLLLVI